MGGPVTISLLDTDVSGFWILHVKGELAQRLSGSVKKKSVPIDVTMGAGAGTGAGVQEDLPPPPHAANNSEASSSTL